MIRKLIGTLALLAVLTVALPSWASAATTTSYPAPPVTTSQVLPTTTSAVAVVTTTTEQAAPASNPLAYTGSGINVGLTVAIGAVVVLLGLSLLVLGSRRAFGKSRHI